jgi:SAM-dependent methyltransferase
MTVRPSGDHFSNVAPAYASCRPRYPETLFDYLTSLAPRTSVAWDCGTGTGQAAVPLASRFERVIATDISPAMVAQAELHPRVQYRVAAAHTSGLSGGSVDLATVAQALHWFDLEPFFAEVARVLRPGGVLAVWTYGRQRLDDPTLDEILDRFYQDAVGPYWPPERRHVESGYRTLPFPFPELPSPGFFLEERWTLRQLLGYIGTWSATERYREQVGHDPRPGLESELVARWGLESMRTVRWPVSLRVALPPDDGRGPSYYIGGDSHRNHRNEDC